jgi:hypothetical protein
MLIPFFAKPAARSTGESTRAMNCAAQAFICLVRMVASAWSPKGACKQLCLVTMVASTSAWKPPQSVGFRRSQNRRLKSRQRRLPRGERRWKKADFLRPTRRFSQDTL